MAKLVGVLVAPGMHGIAPSRAMVPTDFASATLSYAFAGLLATAIVAGSFGIAKAESIGVVTKGAVVTLGGLVLALASPAVVDRLGKPGSLALSAATSVLVVVAGLRAVGLIRTRALGAVLTMFGVAGALKAVAWGCGAIAAEHASLEIYHVSRIVMTGGIVLQGGGALLAAVWLGTRSPPTRGRLLANLAVVLAFAVTFVAARDTSAPSVVQSVLRSSLSLATGSPLPYGLGSVAAFLVPATVFLSLVALVQRGQPPAILAGLSLALISQGRFDVPLQALAITAAGLWALVSMVDERAAWTARLKERSGAG